MKINDEMLIRKATVEDVRSVHELIQPFVQEGRLLPRTLGELYSRVRDFHVCDRGNGKIVGCCGLRVMGEDLAEIFSLAVMKSEQGKGIGRALIKACVNEAKKLKVSRVFVLTYEQRLFERIGFKVVDKNIFPQKIWEDCLKCSKFPNCDEVALLLSLK